MEIKIGKIRCGFDCEPGSLIINLYRKVYSKNTSLGEIYIHDKFFSLTLEPTVRPEIIHVEGYTALSEDVYEIELQKHPERKQLVPKVVGKEVYICCKQSARENDISIQLDANDTKDIEKDLCKIIREAKGKVFLVIKNKSNI